MPSSPPVAHVIVYTFRSTSQSTSPMNCTRQVESRMSAPSAMTCCSPSTRAIAACNEKLARHFSLEADTAAGRPPMIGV